MSFARSLAFVTSAALLFGTAQLSHAELPNLRVLVGRAVRTIYYKGQVERAFRQAEALAARVPGERQATFTAALGDLRAARLPTPARLKLLQTLLGALQRPETIVSFERRVVDQSFAERDDPHEYQRWELKTRVGDAVRTSQLKYNAREVEAAVEGALHLVSYGTLGGARGDRFVIHPDTAWQSIHNVFDATGTFLFRDRVHGESSLGPLPGFRKVQPK
ncbi:MAG: hypothetical protein IT371_29905 [Deltaproteobacteria bacterium]|nr:hypothetical protein [Deltaproteobacteria bacterium]